MIIKTYRGRNLNEIEEHIAQVATLYKEMLDIAYYNVTETDIDLGGQGIKNTIVCVVKWKEKEGVRV